MKKQFKMQINFIIMLFVLFVFLFPKNLVYAWNNGKDFSEDIGPDVSDPSIKWHFTYYTDGDGGFVGRDNPNTGDRFYQDDFEVNEKYGWHEWEYKGVKYVVVAAATREYLEELPDPTYRFLDKQVDHIHYFHYGTKNNNWNFSTFQFQFVDNNDTTVYNGIVLDSCAVSMDPSNPGWNSTEWDGYAYGAKPEGTQWLDVHLPLGYPEMSKYEKFNGKEIKLTADGTFRSENKNSSGNMEFVLKILSGWINLLGDIIQKGLNKSGTDVIEENSSETSTENEGEDNVDNSDIDYIRANNNKLTYTKEEIEESETLKKLIQIGDEDTTQETKTIKNINISNKVDNKKGEVETVYTSSTPIPFIPVDTYSMSINKFKLFDTDFYSTSNNNLNKDWNFVKKIIVTYGHMVLYLSAALLLTILIIRSVLFVKSSLGDNPEGAAESRKIMDNIVKAIILIVGVYVIMPFMTSLYQKILTIIMNKNESIFLIRINVEDVYSFNTNFIGYMKYLALTSNAWAGFGYSIVYCLTAAINGIWYGVMLARMGAIAGLTILAPFTAVMSMRERTPQKGFNIGNILYFGTWLKVYLCFLCLPLIVIVGYRIFLVL